MLIYVKEENVLIAAQEGTGDNLLDEDIAEGLKDYMMTSIYEIDGEEITLQDAGQMMTSVLIKDLRTEDVVRRLLEYWDIAPDESAWAVLDY